MSLKVEGKITVLKGEPTMAKPSASFKSFMKDIGNEEVGFLIECNIIQQQGSNVEVPPVVTIVFNRLQQAVAELANSCSTNFLHKIHLENRCI